jgi:redox-sensitive bicupin YhaK (pirin superfamily)
MITVRKADDRGRTVIDWLDSRHTFSFGEYVDQSHAGFRSLRVINDDRVAPAQGFGTHGHRDMEIVSWVLEGRLAHSDTMGNTALVHPGEVQRMTAGTGIRHAEYNPSRKEPVHFLQIWILPEQQGLPPGYEQRQFTPEELGGKLHLIASREGGGAAIRVHQDVRIWAGRLDSGQRATVELAAGRHAWVQVARGQVTLAAGGPVALDEGDGAQVSSERTLELVGRRDSEVLVFDLA